ncbi:hypothetical protein HanPI659440_Chr06g0239971 [Helianthus annuus]|nr:hypothetical protein HanHA300_Chr06g0216411 [Helianthus annuus]KAJ0573921.1 hypothetical protein HanHA89_Chr06g0232211 [Helianthus annuus]KAJ0738255.1 hypothetical protein HanLR1_Chr06g0216131 [Helianthus annuus]KAJ0780637.1 hypothetical protein HanPI659440_Chr06g0239971 [Helianthus annuus]
MRQKDNKNAIKHFQQRSDQHSHLVSHISAATGSFPSQSRHQEYHLHHPQTRAHVGNQHGQNRLFHHCRRRHHLIPRVSIDAVRSAPISYDLIEKF